MSTHFPNQCLKALQLHAPLPEFEAPLPSPSQAQLPLGTWNQSLSLSILGSETLCGTVARTQPPTVVIAFGNCCMTRWETSKCLKRLTPDLGRRTRLKQANEPIRGSPIYEKSLKLRYSTPLLCFRVLHEAFYRANMRKLSIRWSSVTHHPDSKWGASMKLLFRHLYEMLLRRQRV